MTFDRGINIFFLLPIFNKFAVIRGRHPFHIGHFAHRAKVRIGLAMAVQTPRHAEGLDLHDFSHFSDIAVAGDAANTGVHMRRVIKNSIIRRFMHLYPFDGRLFGPTLPHGQQLFIFCADQHMTIHACLRGRHIRVRRHIDSPVTIPTIHAKITSVQFVAISNRLVRTITDVRIFGRAIIPEQKNNYNKRTNRAEGGKMGCSIRPTGKKLSQNTSPYFGKIAALNYT